MASLVPNTLQADGDMSAGVAYETSRGEVVLVAGGGLKPAPHVPEPRQLQGAERLHQGLSD